MAGTKQFDPLAYIEDAFLDQAGKKKGRTSTTETAGTKFRRTKLSAPRPRRKSAPVETKVIDPDLKALLEAMPRNIEFLAKFYGDDVTANYYQGKFKENREDLIRRLLDPELTLEEVSRLLGVCPATVRRYTNRGWLGHHRTQGGQRRFRLSSLVRFVDEHGRMPE
jgi:excisionase family DNA binding protein